MLWKSKKRKEQESYELNRKKYVGLESRELIINLRALSFLGAMVSLKPELKGELRALIAEADRRKDIIK